MSIDLLFNLLLFVLFGVCFYDINRVENLPDSDIMGAAIWPQMILGLLLILLFINILSIIKANKASPEKSVKFNGELLKDFFTSKLFIGILLVIAMSFLLDPLGFVITVFLFLCAYGYLLGRRNPITLVLISLVASFLLFFLFSKGLSVMLPRGYGVIREFSLMLEMM